MIKKKLLFLFFLLFFSCNDENLEKNYKSKEKKPFFHMMIIPSKIKVPVDGKLIIWGNKIWINLQDKKKNTSVKIDEIDIFINNFLKYKISLKDLLKEEKKLLYLKRNIFLKIPVTKNDQISFKYFIKKKDTKPMYVDVYDNNNKDQLYISFDPL